MLFTAVVVGDLASVPTTGRFPNGWCPCSCLGFALFDGPGYVIARALASGHAGDDRTGPLGGPWGSHGACDHIAGSENTAQCWLIWS